jgi:hypothetical protein
LAGCELGYGEWSIHLFGDDELLEWTGLSRMATRALRDEP